MAESNGNNILSCAICFEKFVTPKIIPCFHSFCCECLQRYIDTVGKKGFFNCPVCRARTKTPKNGAEDFQTNFYLNETIKLKELETTNGEPSTSESISDLKTGLCKHHVGEKVSFFCDVCKVPCCRDCKIEQHDGHRSVKLEEFANRLLPEANELLALVNGKAENLKSLDENLREKVEFVAQEKERIKNLIEERGRVAMATIKKSAIEALNHLTEVAQAATDSLKQKIESTTTSIEKAEAISVSLASTVTSKDPIALLDKIPENRESFDNLQMNINIDELFSGITMVRSMDQTEASSETIFGKVILKRCKTLLRENLEFISSVSIKVDDKFQFVNAILPISYGKAWVAIRSRKDSDKSTMMKMIEWHGHEIMSVSIPGLVNSIVLLPDKNIAVSLPFDDKICVIEGGTNMYELASLRRPVAMTVQGTELFVCSNESGDLRKNQPHCVNRIFVLTIQGHILRTIEFYDGMRIFTSPGKISSTYTGELLVSDFVEKKIFCINTFGKKLHEYSYGNTNVFGVMCDESGHVLIETSTGIVALDGEFNPVRTFTISQPISEITTVAVGPGGKLWIGSVKSSVGIWMYTK